MVARKRKVTASKKTPASASKKTNGHANGSLLDQIRQAHPSELIEMPEWGAAVMIRSVDTKTAMDLWVSEIGDFESMALQIYMSAYHADGSSRIFESVEQAEEILAGVPIELTQRLIEVIGRLNGTSAEERKTMQESFTQADAGAKSTRSRSA